MYGEVKTTVVFFNLQSSYQEGQYTCYGGAEPHERPS